MGGGEGRGERRRGEVGGKREEEGEEGGEEGEEDREGKIGAGTLGSS
jgi:hypothetical protein